MGFDQCLTHLPPPLRHKEFAAPGKKKQQTDSDTCQKNADPFPRL
jgi:hypothetical protein